MPTADRPRHLLAGVYNLTSPSLYLNWVKTLNIIPLLTDDASWSKVQHKNAYKSVFCIIYSPFQLRGDPDIPGKNDAIHLHAQAGDDECYTSGSVFSLVAEENQMWLTDYT